MPSHKKAIPLNEKSHYDPGEIVFAKLKGYPWWPSKIVGESQLPDSIKKHRQKKKNKGAYAIFFYGSLDYAFFGLHSLRVFDRKVVKRALLDGEFKTKDLVEAVEQALDPDFYFDWEDKTQPGGDQESSTGGIQQDRIIDVVTSGKKHVLNSDQTLDRNCKRSRRSIDGSTLTLSSPLPATESYLTKSKSLDAAVKSTPEYERIFKRLYLARHKLQKLIYDKKPGAISTVDYPKINLALKSIEDCEMTKELLKNTKVGKIIRYGGGYVFVGDEFYNLQERCLALLKIWATNILGYHEHTIDDTTSINKSDTSNMNQNGRVELDDDNLAQCINTTALTTEQSSNSVLIDKTSSDYHIVCDLDTSSIPSPNKEATLASSIKNDDISSDQKQSHTPSTAIELPFFSKPNDNGADQSIPIDRNLEKTDNLNRSPTIFTATQPIDASTSDIVHTFWSGHDDVAGNEDDVSTKLTLPDNTFESHSITQQLIISSKNGSGLDSTLHTKNDLYNISTMLTTPIHYDTTNNSPTGWSFNNNTDYHDIAAYITSGTPTQSNERSYGSNSNTPQRTNEDSNDGNKITPLTTPALSNLLSNNSEPIWDPSWPPTSDNHILADTPSYYQHWERQ
ncbi:hypothetical protein BC941DRAFT_445522 [Chlamydoabsidia padenii]|nr:hypothetical protein BC941DRAFT_445522 [Chlamydoabsidia padenii]